MRYDLDFDLIVFYLARHSNELSMKSLYLQVVQVPAQLLKMAHLLLLLKHSQILEKDWWRSGQHQFQRQREQESQ